MQNFLKDNNNHKVGLVFLIEIYKLLNLIIGGPQSNHLFYKWLTDDSEWVFEPLFLMLLHLPSGVHFLRIVPMLLKWWQELQQLLFRLPRHFAWFFLFEPGNQINANGYIFMNTHGHTMNICCLIGNRFNLPEEIWHCISFSFPAWWSSNSFSGQVTLKGY